MLWFHISLADASHVACLGAATGLWLLQHVLWFAQLYYQNYGRRDLLTNSISRLDQGDTGSPGYRVEIPLRRRWDVSHGYYVYITIPSLPESTAAAIQAHPYLLAWVNEGANGHHMNVTLFIQCHRGFSRSLGSCEQDPVIIVDGPYGGGPEFKEYDKTMFIASGVGIAAHLLAVRGLLQAHNDRTARVRRITLLWVLETRRKCYIYSRMNYH